MSLDSLRMFRAALDVRQLSSGGDPRLALIAAASLDDPSRLQPTVQGASECFDAFKDTFGSS
ncbi:MAG: hypothetical protein ACREQO_17795 [Candidatus Binatia bacterium]